MSSLRKIKVQKQRKEKKLLIKEKLKQQHRAQADSKKARSLARKNAISLLGLDKFKVKKRNLTKYQPVSINPCAEIYLKENSDKYQYLRSE